LIGLFDFNLFLFQQNIGVDKIMTTTYNATWRKEQLAALATKPQLYRSEIPLLQLADELHLLLYVVIKSEIITLNLKVCILRIGL